MTSFDQRGDLVPCEVAIEPDQHPPLRAHVRWDLVNLGLALDEHRLHALGRADGECEHAVAMVIVREHRELAVLREPRRLTVAEFFGDTVERHASGSDLRECCGVPHHT
jgi:hypothetical protein